MHPSSRLAGRSESFDEQALEHLDGAEFMILTALRAWLRPRCQVQLAVMDWKEILHKAGLKEDGIEHFDLVMRTLTTVTTRPLDTRCRCATELAGDEAGLLQAIALLQQGQGSQAIKLLGEQFPAPAVSGLLKLIRWFAIDLLDVGLHIRIRERAINYMH
ncbi:hypothetical protein AWB64_04776 [Caballeronia sordidicola]|uniref:Uncharacterized protein n=1 Tax=Caballeronia sordidicola TaxID=196367 RepID=A0A158HMZ6_CABSO|nr:hypothetical protein [Caballeronia sordidicola]SAL45040.1 hypothetical protein AWB64_04776 [Caballeronia sordidicola]